MKKYILTLFATMLFFDSFSQENEDNSKPKGKWHVSKEYDDQGNVVSYDSVYVWSSGNMRDFEFLKMIVYRIISRDLSEILRCRNLISGKGIV